MSLHGDELIERQHPNNQPVTEYTLDGGQVTHIVERRKFPENVEAAEVGIEEQQAKPAEACSVGDDPEVRAGRVTWMHWRQGFEELRQRVVPAPSRRPRPA